MNTIAKPRMYAIAAIGRARIVRRRTIVRRAIRANGRARIEGQAVHSASVTIGGHAMREDRNPIAVRPSPAMREPIEGRDPIVRARIGVHITTGRRGAGIGHGAIVRETETPNVRVDSIAHRTRTGRGESIARETRIVPAASIARKTRIGRAASVARKRRIGRGASVARHMAIDRATRTVRAKTGAHETIGPVTTTGHSSAIVPATAIGGDRIVRAATGGRRSIAGPRRTGRSSSRAVRIPTGRNSRIVDRSRIVRRAIHVAGVPTGPRVAIADRATSTVPTHSVQGTSGLLKTESRRRRSPDRGPRVDGPEGSRLFKKRKPDEPES